MWAFSPRLSRTPTEWVREREKRGSLPYVPRRSGGRIGDCVDFKVQRATGRYTKLAGLPTSGAAKPSNRHLVFIPLPRTKVLTLIAVLGLLLSAAFAGASAPAAHASATQITIMQDGVQVLSDPVGTLDTFRSLGVTEVRIFLSWHGIAPDANSRHRPAGFDATDPADYPAVDWAPYDAAVRAAEARGIGVDFVLTGEAPLWATGTAPRGAATDNPYVYEPSARQFGDFVQAVGTRYDGSYTPSGATAPLPRVNFWGIWNEPNYDDLQPQAVGGVEVSPELYRRLLDTAWSALHATGHGHDTILIGETAPRGASSPGIANGMEPLRFLRALYCVNSSFQEYRGVAASARGCPTTAPASRRFRSDNPALFQATGFAAHLYTFGEVSRPNLPSPSNEPDDASLADLPKLERTLGHLNVIYGSHKKFPIYNTEFGFQTNPPRSQCGCVFLSPATAAYNLNWSEYIEWSNPRVRSDAQYLLDDAPGPLGHTSTESTFSSGLLFVSGAAKADYAAYRLPIYLPITSTRRSRALEVWGDLRPAPFAEHDTGSAQQVQIQFHPATGGAWITQRIVTITNSAGYFRVPVMFPATGSVRLQWTYPSTYAFLPSPLLAPVTSRTQTIKIR